MMRTLRLRKQRPKYWHWFAFWTEEYDQKCMCLAGAKVPRRCNTITLGIMTLRFSWDVNGVTAAAWRQDWNRRALENGVPQR